MYKVFVDDTPLILSTNENGHAHCLSLPLEQANITQIIKNIKAGKRQNVNLFHPNPEQLLPLLKQQLSPITAAGGLVYNPQKEILFIHRLGCWDLPKGKTEANESFEETALREVEEETGVADLSILSPLPTTYHVMERKGEYRLKVTHWFKMQTTYTGKLVPQVEEDITKVVWKNFEESQEALKNTYGNIRLLFPDEYLLP